MFNEEGSLMIRAFIMITITALCFAANTLADEAGIEITSNVTQSPVPTAELEKLTKVQVAANYLRGFLFDAPAQQNACSSNNDCGSGEKCCSLGDSSWCWPESKNCCEAYGGC